MLIIAGECAEDFDELREAFKREYNPQSALEAELVERLAVILWRLRRVPFFEKAILESRQAQLKKIAGSQMASLHHPYEQPHEFGGDDEVDVEEALSDEERSVRVGDALIQDGLYGDGLGKLARHEATLMNGFNKTLQLLLLTQSNRSSVKNEALLLLPSAA
jgi:hypothetical protein